MRRFKIQVQLAKYEVRVTSRKDRHFDPKVNHGLCEPNIKRIYVSKRQTPDCQFTTYIHELMHAIFFELNLYECAYNEPAVETISQTVARAFREMPEGFK